MISRPVFYPVICFLVFVNAIAHAKEFDQDFFLKNLKTNVYAIDTEASAVVLYENISNDIASTNLNKRTIHRIIKILKEDAKEEGKITITYSTAGEREHLGVIKGTTYNLSGDKMDTVSITSADLLNKKIYNNHYELSFSMPAVKEGSIIDYSYEEYYNFRSDELIWHAQGTLPKLLAEFSVIYPKYFEFSTLTHKHSGIKPYPSDAEAEAGTDDFCYTTKEYEKTRRCFWLRKNISGIKPEPYVVNMNNQLERLEFLCTGYVTSFGTVVHTDSSWGQINEKLWVNAGVDKLINNNNKYLDRIIDSVTTPSMAPADKARAIYNYVRSNIKRIESTHVSFSKDALMDVYKYKEGNQEEISLFLTSMLSRAGITATPVLISTTENLPLNNFLPLINRIDYTACAVMIDSSYVFLDASNKNNCYGQLPPECYNGFAWVLGKTGEAVNLTADMIKEKTITSVNINDFKETSAKVAVVEKLGTFTSEALRKEWAAHKEKKEEYIAKLKKGFTDNIDNIEIKIENLDNPDTNLIVRYTCDMNYEKNFSSLFMSSTFVKMLEKNPFSAANRKLPIEFAYKSQNDYHMNVLLPKNLAPDSVAAQPLILDYESSAIQYKKSASYFPQLNTMTVNASLIINTTTYTTDYYSSIRAFFQKVIDENNEMIILKKTM